MHTYTHFNAIKKEKLNLKRNSIDKNKYNIRISAGPIWALDLKLSVACFNSKW